MAGQAWSQTWTFYDGKWHEGNVPLWGVRTHAIWLGSSVFDGARVFEGVAPDIDQHCARVNASAKTMYLKPQLSVDEWLGLVREGMAKFDKDTPLYVRPMYWAERASPMALPPDPESTRFALSLYDTPMRKPDGFSVTLSPFRRPTYETAPVDAKAGCLYPNNARAMFEARSRGFDNCIVRDAAGNVAELANSNVFMAKDGVVYTPIPNNTFLAGITRKRVIGLMRDGRHFGGRDRAALRGFRDAPTRFSRPATPPRCCRSPASTTAPCSPGRCTARRARSIGNSRILEQGETMIARFARARLVRNAVLACAGVLLCSGALAQQPAAPPLPPPQQVPAAPAPPPVNLKAHFEIIMTHIQVGELNWAVYFDNGAYTAAASGKASGVFSVLVKGEGSVTTHGSVIAGRLLPQTSRSEVSDDDGAYRVTLTFDDGALTHVADKGAPPPEDRVHVTKNLLRDVADPLSAMLIPFARQRLRAGQLRPHAAHFRRAPAL